MFSVIMKTVQFLNTYSNLMLVVITAIYVWLTAHSLRAFRESTLRDREARHLQEIKENVIQPIVSWMDATVLGRFTGRSPELLRISGGYAGDPWQLCHTVDDPFTGRRSLKVAGDTGVPDQLTTWTSTESNRVSQFLFDHSKKAHFRRELEEFDDILDAVSRLTGDILALANESANEVAGSELQHAPNYDAENTMPEWANPFLLAAVCVDSLLSGEFSPGTKTQTTPGGCLLLTEDNQPIAKAMDAEKLSNWSGLGFEKFRRRWEANKLPERIRGLLDDAAIVRRNVHQLMFTHSLGVDCELVSGKTGC